MMPIFSYECPNDVCPDWEVLCKYEDDDHGCPACGCEYTKRKMSAPKGYVKKGVYEEFL